MGIRSSAAGLGLDIEYLQPVNVNLVGGANRYVAKFVCGELDQLNPEAVPAIYRTAINILNQNQGTSVNIFKAVTITLPERSEVLGPFVDFPAVPEVLPSFRGMVIDCDDIRFLLAGTGFEDEPFITGFVIIDVSSPTGETVELQVAAVYTALHKQ